MGVRWRAIRGALCTVILCCTWPGAPRIAAQVEIAGSGAGGGAARASAQDSVRNRLAAGPDDERISIQLRAVPLKEALRAIARESGVALFYNDRDIPLEKRVTIAVSEATVAESLRLALHGTALIARVTPAGILIEAPRGAPAPASGGDTTGSISGSVTDSTTGEAIVGATITLRGNNRGATSGDDGRFHIAGIESGAYTIVVRRLGYSERSRAVLVPAGGDVTAAFTLAPAPRMLDQIVTTATGDQARRQVGNLVATIQADSVMATAPVSNISQLLAGRAAGVQVYFGGGLTGVSPPINIRGQNSLSLSNQPLLVVDGVRVENSTTGFITEPTLAGLSSGRFNDIDPSEIESIEIVKGPSAATLYGTDAANGVILVKTKKGSAGPPAWSAFAEGGILTFDRERFPTSYFPWGHLSAGSTNPSRCVLLAVSAGTCTQDSITSFSPLRNAETSPIGSGRRQQAGVQLRGGALVRYFLSATEESETGYLEMPSVDRKLLETQAGRELTNEELHPNAIRRYGVRGNFTVPVSETIDIGLSAALDHVEIRIPDPTVVLYGGVATGFRDANDGWTFGRRAGDYLIKRDREHVAHFTGGLSGSWHPHDWLSGSVTTGLDLSTDYIDRLVPAGLGFSAGTMAGARENTKVTGALQTIDARLSATLPLSPTVSTRTSVGGQYNRRLLLTNTAAAENLVPGAETVAGGALQLASESTIETVVAGAYLEEMLGWRDKLYITGGARVDGASSFGAGFRAAVYPKASVSWLLSEERFWPRIPGVTSLRFRAAYGASGVQPGPIAALQAETLFPVAIGSGVTTGARLGEIGNRELRPELQREFEGGLDMELLNGRFAVQATYYDKRSKDALMSVALPSSYGGGTQWRNVGAVRNRGYEALLDARLLATPALSWHLTVNGSINDNTVLAISPSIDAIYRSGTVFPSLVRGYPLKSYFDYPIESFSDADGNGIITPSEVTVGDEPEYAGSGYPRTQISATTTVGILGERLKVSATAERRSGYVIANIAESLRCIFGACGGAVFRGEDLSAQAANVARGTASLHRTYWGYYEDGSFTRLRELSLTYSLPKSLTRRLMVDAATMTLSGRNLALWSAYRGTDPEVQSTPGSADVAATFDRTGVPAPAYWLLRINVAF